MFHTIRAQDRAGSCHPGCDVHVVFLSQLCHVVLSNHILITAVMVQIIVGTAGNTGSRAGEHHRSIEAGEVSTCQQDGHHQHVPHCLPPLKFHHAGGNQVPILFFLAAPSIDHGVEQKNVQADQCRQVEQCIHHGGGIPVENFDEKAGHEVPQEASQCNEEDANRTIPPWDSADGFRFMGFLNNINDIGATNGAPAHQEQHEDDEDGKGQCKEVGLRVKTQNHFLGIHDHGTEDLPDAPGQRNTQQGTSGAGAQREKGQFLAQFRFQLVPGGTQGQKGANFPGLLTEKQTGGIRGKNRAAQNGQNKDHHYLLSGVPSLWQNGEDSGRPHHAGVSCDKKNGKKGTSGQQSVLPPIFPPEMAINF